MSVFFLSLEKRVLLLMDILKIADKTYDLIGISGFKVTMETATELYALVIVTSKIHAFINSEA